jgi:hypothetical protein
MLKKLFQSFVRLNQRILVVVFLTVIYFLGLGITRIFIILFKRKAIAGPDKNKCSFWVAGQGYMPDSEDSRHQS